MDTAPGPPSATRARATSSSASRRASASRRSGAGSPTAVRGIGPSCQTGRRSPCLGRMTHAGGFSFTSGGGRPTGQEMSDAALAKTGDRGLAAALATHPDARVTGVLETGRFCALPDELGSTHERLPGETMFDLVPKSEWTRVIAGWQLTKQHGTHVGTLTVNDGSEISVLTF